MNKFDIYRRGLMAKDEWKNLGFHEKDEILDTEK